MTTGPDLLEVRDVPDPVPADRALVRVRRAGLCGTDTKILRGAIAVDHPRILGHELFGTVVRAAPNGTLPEGTAVLIDPSVSCGRCPPCHAGRPHLCVRGGLLGRDLDGGFADLVAADERQLHVVPDTVPEDEAALLQVLGTCVHGQQRVTADAGGTGLVIGLGVTGLLHVQLLRARGLRVVAVTRSAEKLAVARELGAEVTATPAEAAEAVASATDGRGCDVVVESVGRFSTLRQSIELAAIGADVLLYGLINEPSGELPFYDVYLKELRLIACRAADPGDYARGIDLVAAGLVRLAPLLSASYPLEDVREAFAALDDPGTLKVLLTVS